MAKKVFISYRRADTEAIAGRLRDRLLTHLPASHVFFDTGSIAGGELFANRIEGAAKSFDTMVVMMGPGWAGPPTEPSGRGRLWQDDDYVRLEVRTGLARAGKMTVLPVLIDATPVPDRAALPEDLHGLLSHNVMRLSNASFDRDFDAIFARTQGKTVTQAGRRWSFRILTRTVAGAVIGSLALLVVGLVNKAVFKQALDVSLGGAGAVELAAVLVVGAGAAAGYFYGARR